MTVISRTFRLAGGALLLAAAVALVPGGCSSSNSTATVTGTVTYKGALVKAGEITFLGEGIARSAVIGTDGRYQIDHAPLGEVSVGLVSVTQEYEKGQAPPPSADGDAPGGPPPRMIEKSLIPKKYNDPKSSGLKFTLKAGLQTIDLELKD